MSKSSLILTWQNVKKITHYDKKIFRTKILICTSLCDGKEAKKMRKID